MGSIGSKGEKVDYEIVRCPPGCRPENPVIRLVPCTNYQQSHQQYQQQPYHQQQCNYC